MNSCGSTLKIETNVIDIHTTLTNVEYRGSLKGVWGLVNTS